MGVTVEMFLSICCRSGRRLLPLAAVVEVLPMVKLAPGAGRCQGVLVHRAQALPVFDTTPDALPYPEAADWLLVVVEGAARRHALVAQAAEGVVHLPLGDVSLMDLGDGHLARGAVLDGVYVPILEPDGPWT